MSKLLAWQQWYLKGWKFRKTNVNAESYADSIFESLLKSLDYQANIDAILAQKS